MSGSVTIGIVAGLLATALLVRLAVRPLKLLLFRAVVREGLKDIGNKAIAKQPDAIHLVPSTAHAWKNAAACDALARPLLARGFVDAGSYRIAEMPGVTLRFLLNDATNSYASIYEHDRAGNWVELISRYQDGSGATFTMRPDRGMKHRVQDFVVHAPGTDVGALYERMLEERPQRPLIDLNAEQLPRLFENVYAEQIKWRKQRGADPGEVARVVVSLKQNPIGKGAAQD